MVCFDAKFNFDDSAKFRQRDVFAMDDESESDPREVEAGKHALNYISLDGDIACLGKRKPLLRFSNRSISYAHMLYLTQQILMSTNQKLQRTLSLSFIFFVIPRSPWVG